MPAPSLRLHNTLTGQREPLVPRNNRLGLYVCGITPYDVSHLGHARTYTVFDVLVRYLRYRGLEVTYVQNVTDVDDDILREAARRGVPFRQLARVNTQAFLESMDALNVQRPDHMPHATQEVPAMLEMIAPLLEAGHAYRSGGNVYFRLARDADYGKLGKLGREEMLALAAEHGGNPDDPRKEDPLDFVLWQESEPGEPVWESPWGAGRPGWHIECSAMARRYLGQPVDIHGGGEDLVFPHHESEIAQAEKSGGREPFARCWMHVGMVRLEGVKMSKSLGNMIFVDELLRDFPAGAVRLYLLSAHYREEWDYRREGLRETDRLLGHLQEAVRQADGPAGEGLDRGTERRPDEELDRRMRRGRGDELDPEPQRRAFLAAMDDDLDTPKAIAALADLTSAILAARSRGQPTASARSALAELAGILGVTLTNLTPC